MNTPNGETDPVQCICRWLDHGTSDAVQEWIKNTNPTTPLAKLPAIHTPTEHDVDWIFGALCDQLDLESRNALYGERNTDDLLSSFAFFMERKAAYYLKKRHLDDARIAAAFQAVRDSVKIIGYDCGGEQGHLYALAVTPAEFRKRLAALLKLDAAPATQSAKPSKKKGNNRGKKISAATAKQNTDCNELIYEVRRRHNDKGLTLEAAYDEIESESINHARSKWCKIIGIKDKSQILNMAQHGRYYTTTVTEPQQR